MTETLTEITFQPSDLEAKPWQKGYRLEDLKAVARLFKQHDNGLILGAFTAAKELAVANWLAEGSLRVFGTGLVPECAVVCKQTGSKSTVTDFTGSPRCTIPADSFVIKRWAVGVSARRAELLRECIDRVIFHRTCFWIESWAEHFLDADLVRSLGAQLQAVKIAASSEIRHVSSVGVKEVAPAYEREEQAHLVRLPLHVDPDAFASAVAAIEKLPEIWQQHYSGYNKGQTWTAAALRGYGGKAEFIQKPAEMSKSWKEENAEKLEWKPADTALRSALPSFERLLATIPTTEFQRIRLMKITSGGGELTRHADITDREAGVRLGAVVRIHLPLITNPHVLFEGWDIYGKRIVVRMPAGEWWYLDQRKPHTAKNVGATDRIHLVCDVICTEGLRAALSAAN